MRRGGVRRVWCCDGARLEDERDVSNATFAVASVVAKCKQNMQDGNNHNDARVFGDGRDLPWTLAACTISGRAVHGGLVALVAYKTRRNPGERG